METTKRTNLNRLSLNSFCKFGSLIFCALFMALYLELFREHTLSITHDIIGVCLRALPVFIVFLVIGYILLEKNGEWLGKVFRLRFHIGLILFLLVLAFDISGSSIGIWANFLPYSDDTGLIWGKYQGIRGDEWGVNAPFYLSQEQNSFAPVNDMIRGVETSVTLMPSLPSYSPIAIFKPFFWGFLLFGASKGFAWSWGLSYISLFLVTIELFLILTNRNKVLSVLAAFLVTFSPCTQWWNSVDLLLYGQGIIVCMYYFLTSSNTKKKIVFAILVPWLCFCYLFVAYPAWQVTYFFILAILGIWMIVHFRHRIQSTFKYLCTKKTKINAIPIIVLLLTLVICACFTLLIFIEANPSIEGMSQTIYPGKRSSLGGGQLDYLLNWIPSLFFSISQLGFDYGNECEFSAFFSLFPLGFAMACVVIYQYKNRLLIALAALSVVYLLYFTVGVPEVVSRFTLLSMTTSSRIILPWGYINILLLVLSVHYLFNIPGNDLDKEIKGTHNSRHLYSGLCVILILVLLIACIVCVFVPNEGLSDSFWTLRFIFLLIVLFLSISLSIIFLCRVGGGKGKKLFSMVLCGIVFVVGISINPLQHGISVVTENEAYTTIEDIADRDSDALWITEGGPYYSNICAAAGARTLSSTNTYPNVDLWNELDPSGTYEEVYLRYANINIDVENEMHDTMFELVAGDAILVNLTPSDLKKIGVKYLLADEKHEDSDGIHFEELYSAISPSREFIIYKLEY